MCSLDDPLFDRVADGHAVAVGAVDLLTAEDVGLDHLAGDIHGHAVAVGLVDFVFAIVDAFFDDEVRFDYRQAVAVGFVDLVAVTGPVLDDGLRLQLGDAITTGAVDLVAVVDAGLDDRLRIDFAPSAVVDVVDFARRALINDVARVSLGQERIRGRQ